MRKFSFYLALIIIMSVSVSAQTVTLTPTSVNGSSFSGGAINLGGVSYSSISLSVKVEIPGNVAVGDQGTIKIYCSNSAALGANVTIGGDGGSLYFGGGKVATKSFNINLIWGDFLTSSGYIFAEYRNPAGTAYKSSNIAVIKNATLNGGTVNPPADAPNPTQIANTLCCNQTIRQGEKPTPITGSQYTNPYQNQIYGINSSWSGTGNNSVRFTSIDYVNKILNIDYVTEPGNFTIIRKLGYNGNNDFPNKSNSVTITVVPSPISSNEIYINGSTNNDGSIEATSTNPKDILGSTSSINLNVLQNPFYTPKRGDTNITIDKYEWEYSIMNGTTEESSWNIIPNQSAASLNSLFLPRSNSSKDNFYQVRRIAIYENLRVSSNSLKIWLRAVRDNNTICCDQTLQVSPSNVIETPSTITGTTTVSDKNTYLFYQWQSQTVTEHGSRFGNWTNIPRATSKDYTPPTPQFIPGSGRNPATAPTYNYRRIATDNAFNGETYYSNEVRITPSTNLYSVSTLKLYPNPATSIINIENTDTSLYGNKNFANATITIVNMMGTIVNSNNFSVLTPDLISINISNLPTGTYFLNISGNITNRITYNEQFTFIKN